MESSLTLVSQRTRPVCNSSARKTPLHEPMKTRSPTTVGVCASQPPASKCHSGDPASGGCCLETPWDRGTSTISASQAASTGVCMGYSFPMNALVSAARPIRMLLERRLAGGSYTSRTPAFGQRRVSIASASTGMTRSCPRAKGASFALDFRVRSLLSWIICGINVRDRPRADPVNLNNRLLVRPGEMVRLRLHDRHASTGQWFGPRRIEFVAHAHIERA